ncbi:hypothetical protein CR513_53803, partial [Mucuna pruriens]
MRSWPPSTSQGVVYAPRDHDPEKRDTTSLTPPADKYDGTLDPNEHTDAYVTQVNIFTNNDAIICRAFPISLKKATLNYSLYDIQASPPNVGCTGESLIGGGRVTPLLHGALCSNYKCEFGVHDGKFLGFMLTHKGVKANLNMCNAIINMKNPKAPDLSFNFPESRPSSTGMRAAKKPSKPSRGSSPRPQS